MKEDAHMMPAARKRRWPQVLLAVAGFLVVAVAAVIGQQRYGQSGQFSLSQANGLCASAFGQLVQAERAGEHELCVGGGGGAGADVAVRHRPGDDPQCYRVAGLQRLGEASHMMDAEALDRITSLLVSAAYHDDANTLSEIAAIVAATGRKPT